MSAGTIPELRLSSTVPAGPIDTAEAPDPVLRRLIEVCASAVDPLEIAAAIEAEGLGDRAVRTRYGFADVFAMADHLWRTVPRQPTEPPAQPDPWRGNTLRGALHGLLYGLPAVFFPAGVGLLADPGKQVGTSGTVVVLGVSMLSSWPASQAVASLGYTRAGRLDVGGARRLMRLGLVVALLAVLAALAVTALVVPVRGTALAFGVGQAGYMLGASVLMVLGSVDGADPGKRVGSIDADPGKRVGSVDGADRGKRVGGEQLLLVALAPGVLVGGGYLLLGRPSGLAHPMWWTLAATPLLALVFAGARLARPPAASGKLLVLGELRDAGLAALFGLIAAALLAFPVLAGADGHGVSNTGALLATLPLSLSMGPAEWFLLGYRRRTQRLLRTSRHLEEFTPLARLALSIAVLRYLFSAVVLIAIATAVAGVTGIVSPQWTLAPAVIGYLGLGGAMFLALLLQTFRLRAAPLLACAGALVVEIALRGWGAVGQLVVCLALLATLATVALTALGKATPHAF